MCVRHLNRLRRTFLVPSREPTFTPASEWMPMTGISVADFLLRIVAATEPCELKPGIQIARTRTDHPDPGEVIASGEYVESVGLHHFRENPDWAVGAFVRFGLVGRLRGARRSPSLVEAELDVSLQERGEVLGTKIVEVQPFAMGSDEDDAAIVPITDWKPTAGVASIKGVFVLLDNVNSALMYRLVARTAQDRMEPDGWSALEAWQRPQSGNSERNSGERPVPDAFAQRHLFQLGVAFRRTPLAEQNPRCLLHTLAHSRFA